jgi:hypothetical protein
VSKHVVWAGILLRGRQNFRPVESYRKLSRGKNKGSYEVVLYDGKKRIVSRASMRGLPPE